MAELRISPTLSLPPSMVTQRAALLAVSGAGKSNAARCMAEEFFAARLPFVAVDPKGDWWGLRAGRDGKPAGGLDVVIFGGEHGDIPLERGGGNLVADTIVDQRLSCVVDLSGFDSEADRKAFLLDFARRLYHRNRDPLHLFLEEADDYVPQRPMKDELRLVRAFENIVRRGRSKGLGITLITQRSACVNKNVLTQVETLFALRTTGPQDIAAIEAWMKYHGADRAMLASLATLEDGEAWVWSPHQLKKTERFRFRRSATFDSGATPTNHAAGSRRAPATLADVDIAGLTERMAATIERAQADDPKALRKRVAELERQLSQQPPPDPTAQAELERAREWARGIEGELRRVRRKLSNALATLRAAITDATAAARQLEELSWAQSEERYASAAGGQAGTEDGATEPAPRLADFSSGKGDIGKCARALLAALVQHGDLSLQQAAIIAGYAPTSGGVRNSAGELRAMGLIGGGNDRMTATPKGRQHPELRGVGPLPTGPALAKHWLGHLGRCEALLLQHVLERYPKAVSLAQAATASGYEPNSGGVRNAAGRLRTLMLINGTNAAITANERLIA